MDAERNGHRVPAKRRWALVDHDRLVGSNRKFFPLHQWCCVPDSFASGSPRHSTDRSRPAVVDAQLGNGGHVGSLGLCAGPRRRKDRADGRLGAHRGCGLCRGARAPASRNVAGARRVSAWSPPQQRGLAMGIRQTAQPLGIALGALVIPELAERSVRGGLMLPALVCTAAAVASALGITNPPRKSRKTATEQDLASPYRGSLVLWRIHAVAGLLMMPQTVTVTFMLVWLMNHHGWSVGAAGVLVTLAQLLGALGRVLVGRWSDRVGSRMWPVRLIALGGAGGFVLLALGDHV